MNPVIFLAIALGLTVVATATQWGAHAYRTRGLRRLARQNEMHFCYNDRFRFAPMVAEAFPIAGAADVRVLDMLYGSRDDLHRYVFTVEFTRGVVRTKSRRRRVAAFVEPRRAARHRPLDLRLADEKLSILDQYGALCESVLSNRPSLPERDAPNEGE